MTEGFSNPITAGDDLVIPMMQSPGFVAGASGWAVFRNGNAEFNGATFRGGVIEDGTGLYYSPSPGAGTLIASVDAAGPDQYANPTLPGIVSYQPGSTATQLYEGAVTFYAWQSSAWVDTAGIGATLAGPGLAIGGNGVTFYYYFGSGDATGATDTAAVNSLLAAGNVILAGSRYYINGPLNIPPYRSLSGMSGPESLNQDPIVNAPRIIAVSSWAPSATVGMVQFLSKTPGSWLSEAQSQELKGLILDGSENSSTHVQGIQFTGPCYDTHVADVLVYSAPHNGISLTSQAESGIGPTYPYHQRWTRLAVVSAGNNGFALANMTDSTFDGCLAFGNHGDNWSLANMSNCILTACRAEWSATGHGFHFTSAGWSGTIVLSGCSTDHNAGNGVYVDSVSPDATEQCGIVISGMKCHADQGADAVRIQGTGFPVTITGLAIDVGQNPNTSANYPASGVSVGANSAAVVVSGSTLGAITTPWAWDSTGTVARSGCVSVTGLPGAQVFARLADI